MEIDSGAKPAMAGQANQAAKVAATGLVQTRQKLPPIEAKAPPKVADFEPKDIDKNERISDSELFSVALARSLISGDGTPNTLPMSAILIFCASINCASCEVTPID